MSATRVLFTSVACMMFVAMLLGDFQSAEARYLPTRSNSDRLDKLRELLKEVSKMYKVQRRPLSSSVTKCQRNHFSYFRARSRKRSTRRTDRRDGTQKASCFINARPNRRRLSNKQQTPRQKLTETDKKLDFNIFK